MSFQINRLLRRGNVLIQSVQRRRMADWINPKYKGGDAEAHDLPRYWQQFLHSDGEKLFAFAGSFIAPFGILYLYSDEFYFNRRKLQVEKYINTSYIYPVAKREE